MKYYIIDKSDSKFGYWDPALQGGIYTWSGRNGSRPEDGGMPRSAKPHPEALSFRSLKAAREWLEANEDNMHGFPEIVRR